MATLKFSIADSDENFRPSKKRFRLTSKERLNA